MLKIALAFYIEWKAKRMKKVGIITFYKSDNLGAVLQAYALHRCVAQNGYAAEIIQYSDIKKKQQKMNFGKRILHNLWFKTVKRGLFKDKKWSRVESFVEKYDALSAQAYYSSAEINQDPPRYDVYITGSDQVWNDSITGADDSYFLSFAPDESVKLAYGASCGSIKEMMKNNEKKRMLLSRLDAVGAREDALVQILKREYSIDSELVLDPTLLLRSDEWSCVAEASEIIRTDNYILCYVMPGDSVVETGIDQIANELAARTGYKVVRLGLKDTARLRFRKDDIFDAGPAEFVRLIADAKYVVTNSFHGSVFSINFKKNVFGILNGKEDAGATRATRLISIYKLLGMEDRLIPFTTENDNWKTAITTNHYDYAQVNQKLEAERRKSISYLIMGIAQQKESNEQ